MSDPKSPLQRDARGNNRARQTLADFSLPSERGNERQAMEEVAKAVSGLGLPEKTLEKLKTAVAEAALNAMEHGNHYRAELPVLIEVSASEAEISVKITDEGGGPPAFHPETPDLEAKLEGAQTPRGWGLFLIKNMVDDMNVTGDEHHHTVELILRLDGRAEGDK
jgi:serine/threonine-protein kinase RsbW